MRISAPSLVLCIFLAGCAAQVDPTDPRFREPESWTSWTHPVHGYALDVPAGWTTALDDAGDAVILPYDGDGGPDRREGLRILRLADTSIEEAEDGLAPQSVPCSSAIEPLDHETAIEFVCEHADPPRTSFHTLIKRGPDVWRLVSVRTPESDPRYGPIVRHMVRSFHLAE